MMKWGRILAAVLAMMVVLPATAQVKIGVVDLRQALFTSSASKAFSKQMQSQFKGQEQKLKKAHDAAQKIKDRLDKDGAMMNDTERSKLADSFQEKAKQFKYMQDQLNSAVNKRKKAFLDKAKPDMDLTSELIDKLNHKKIDVSSSGNN